MSRFYQHHLISTSDPGDSDPLPPGERGHLIAAAIRAIGRRPAAAIRAGAEDALNFLGDHPELFGVVARDRVSEATPQQREVALRAELDRIEASTPRAKPTALDSRIAWLGALTGLSALDRSIAAIALRRRTLPLWASLCERALDQPGRLLKASLIGVMLGVTAHAVRQRLQHHSPLLLAGLIEDHEDDDFSASDFLLRLGRVRTTDPVRLAALMLRPEPRSTLGWDDFAHFRGERDLAADMIGASARLRHGVNLLLHGLPGTGKTEFARALADRLGLDAIFIGKANSYGGEPKRSERLAHLSVVRALTRRSRRHLIVIDEADDLMVAPGGGERTAGSKLWLNHLIERSTGPTIWIANDLTLLSDPVIRRMTAAIGFAMPPPPVRERVLERQATVSGLNLTAIDLKRLASLPVAPAVTANAISVAALTKGGAATIERVAIGLGEALGITPVPASRKSCVFDPAFSRADFDLEVLTDRLAGGGHRDWSMLLEGVSGTGKSAFARHLADRLGLELIERRGSDLLGPYVGETERLIARTFREAAERGALLLLDEADALLRDRRGAVRPWEVSMTNEMLNWMERHPMPFIVTTNLADTLDQAAMRRFLFRVGFDTLDAARANLLWTRYFGDPAPNALARIDGLVPSDFAVVARRIAAGGDASVESRLGMLRTEARHRDGSSAKIGFLAD